MSDLKKLMETPVQIGISSRGFSPDPLDKPWMRPGARVVYNLNSKQKGLTGTLVEHGWANGWDIHPDGRGANVRHAVYRDNILRPVRVLEDLARCADGPLWDEPA